MLFAITDDHPPPPKGGPKGMSSPRLPCAHFLAAIQPALLIRKVDLHGNAALVQLPFLDREAAIREQNRPQAASPPTRKACLSDAYLTPKSGAASIRS
jgi:hypothetical protein